MTDRSDPSADAVTLWRRHLEFEPEEARRLGDEVAGARPLERLAEQVEFYREVAARDDLASHPDGIALSRLARLAVRRFERGDDRRNLERTFFASWVGMAEPAEFLAAQERLLRDGIARGETPDDGLVASFVESVLPATRDAAATESARAAWDRHLAFFRDELLPAASPGAWRLGEDEYRWRLANMGVADDPVALGREQLARVQAELVERLEVSDFAAARERLRSIGARRVPDGEVVASYREANRACVEFVAREQLFAIEPDLDVPLDAVPAGGAAVTHAGNVPAPLFGVGGGAFQVLDDATRHAAHWVTPLAVHEGVPGHFLQSRLWQQAFRASGAAPAFVSVPDPNASERHDWGAMLAIEGWAVYAEELMLRAGFHAPKAAAAVLGFHLIRCVRAIADAELHAGRLEPDAAVALFVDAAGLDEANARREVVRCQRVPTQPATYLLGWRRIEALVAEATAAGLSRPAAHARLLAAGPVLPPTLVAPAGE